MVSIMDALVISLLAAGPGWTVVWSNAMRVDARDFLRRDDAVQFFNLLASQNRRATRFVEGKII